MAKGRPIAIVQVVNRKLPRSIHEAPAGEAGDIVVTLFSSETPLPDTITGVKGCAIDVSGALIRDIIKNPGEYYVNVHNVEFPAGAIRGQLD